MSYESFAYVPRFGFTGSMHRGSFQVVGLQLVERLGSSGVNLQKQVQPADPPTRRRAREKRKKAITALIMAPAGVQAEDVAELARLVGGAGLRFESGLDLFLISHAS